MTEDKSKSSIGISASSYTTFLSCKRKWWLEKVKGLPTRKTPALQMGIDIHDWLEAYLKGEEPPVIKEKLVNVAKSGIEHLPEPGTVRVEEWVKTKCAGMPFRGKVDFYTVEDDGTLHISDHKTTSRPANAKTSEELSYNPQMLAYAYTLAKTLGIKPERVKLTHIYYLTKGVPSSWKVDSETSWERIQKNWKDFERVARVMQRYMKIKEQKQVPPNLQACRFCSFKQDCEAYTVGKEKKVKQTGEVMPASKESKDKTNELRKRLGLAPLSEEEQTEVYENHPTQFVRGEIGFSKKDYEAKRAPDTTAEDMFASLKIIDQTNIRNVARAILLHLTREETCSEEKMNSYIRTVGGFSRSNVKRRNAVISAMLIAKVPIVFDKVQKVLTLVPTEKEVFVAEKLAEAAKKLSGNLLEDRVQAAAKEEAEAAEEAALVTKNQKKKKLSKFTTTVYIGAVPSDHIPKNLSKILEPLELEVAEENGLPYYGVAAYHMGPKLLASKFLVKLEERGAISFLGESVFVSGRHPAISELLPILQRHESIRIIRGVSL